MSRNPDPDYPFKMVERRSRGHLYAATKKRIPSTTSDKIISTDIFWGKLEETEANDDFKYRFIPNKSFCLLEEAERSRFIFPPDWDISEYNKLKDKQISLAAEIIGVVDSSTLYGDIWLMNTIAEKTGLLADLAKVFDGNRVKVEDTLTLAYHMYLTRFSWNRIHDWQRIAKTPTPESRPLTSGYITEFAQSITEKHRSSLLRLRLNKAADDDLICIDTTTHSAYGGKRLSDIDWGNNKDDKQLPCTVDVLAYSLKEHQPVYYRSLPGNMVDIHTPKLIMDEMKALGFKNSFISVTDRGFDSDDLLQWHIKNRFPFITMGKIGTRYINKYIPEFEYVGIPCDMDMDYDEMLYYRQHKEDYTFIDTDGNEYSGEITVNLYFNPKFIGQKQFNLKKDIQEEADQLINYGGQQKPMSDEEVKKFKYHKIERDEQSLVVTGFTEKHEKVSKAKRSVGFFAVLTYQVDLDPVETLKTYELRQEQENCFEIEKEQMDQDKQDVWTEGSKTGRKFITFVGNTLICYARNMWKKDPELFDTFDSTAAIFDRMRSIRFLSHPACPTQITPLVGDQVLVAKKFEMTVPDEALPQKEREAKPKVSKKKASKKAPRKHVNY